VYWRHGRYKDLPEQLCFRQSASARPLSPFSHFGEPVELRKYIVVPERWLSQSKALQECFSAETNFSSEKLELYLCRASGDNISLSRNTELKSRQSLKSKRLGGLVGDEPIKLIWLSRSKAVFDVEGPKKSYTFSLFP